MKEEGTSSKENIVSQLSFLSACLRTFYFVFSFLLFFIHFHISKCSLPDTTRNNFSKTKKEETRHHNNINMESFTMLN